MLNIDWQAVQRLDNAMLVQFLTSSASVLHKHSLITPKETDNLRVALSRLNAPGSNGPGSPSLLAELDRSGDEIFSILKYRFGMNAMALNLIRLCVQQSLQPLVSTLVVSGEILIKKSEIVFNRPLYIYGAGKRQVKTLYSTFVIDLAEQVATTAAALKDISARLGRMIPSQEPSGNDVVIDLEIAEALGFDGLSDRLLPANEERALMRRIHQTVLDFAEYCSEFADQVLQNGRTESGHNLLAAAEILKAECLRLAAISFPEGDAITMWETRRRHLAANISSIGEVLKMTCNACEEAVNFEKAGLEELNDRESLKNRLIMAMVGSGTHVSQAAKAAADFMTYLRDKQLKPTQVIAGELSRINPQLSIKCLEILQEDCNQTRSTPETTEQKKRVITRSRAVSDRLKAIAVSGVLLLTICPTLISCGLKTNPVNDAAELRPDIPFKNQRDQRPAYIKPQNSDIPASKN